LLADLYRRLGRTPDAHSLFAAAMSRRTLSVELIKAAADFYASQKRMDQASIALARLGDLQLHPGVGELALANFEDRFGTPENALKQYVAATHAAPTDAETWRQLAMFHLRALKFDEAIGAIDGGLKAVPSNTDLKSLRAIAADLLTA